MGVTYKLKKEIVDFIINEKRQDPSLGCRSLVNLIGEKFQTKISKSSINAVIKEAQLSSSVGRKPLAVKKPPKFRIPDATKNQLFTNDSKKIDPSIETVNTNKSKKLNLETLSCNNVIRETTAHKIARKIKNTVSPVKKVLVIGEDRSRGILYDGMGGFFLKAAQWQLSLRPKLEAILSKYLAPDLIKEAGLLGEVLLSLPALGIKSLSDIDFYEGKGLGVLHGREERISSEKLISFVNGIRDIRNFSLRLSNEIPQIFSEGVYIKMVLEDQSEIFMDAQFRTISAAYKNENCFFCPIEKLTGNAIDFIIRNVQPLIIQKLSNKIDLKFLNNLNLAFNNVQEKRIVKLEIGDDKGGVLSQFSSIPFKKRNFIVGADPAQVNFPDLHFPETADFIEVKGLINDCKVEFYEMVVNLPAEPTLEEYPFVRAVWVNILCEGKKNSFIIFTNIPQGFWSVEEIVREYLKKWPYSQTIVSQDILPEKKEKEVFNPLGNYKNFLKDGKSLQVIADRRFSRDWLEKMGEASLYSYLPDGWEGFIALFFGLNSYCRRHFFSRWPENSNIPLIRESIYQLPGYVERDQNFFAVTLDLPRDYKYKEELEFALQRLNEVQIRDYNGIILWMNIQKS